MTILEEIERAVEQLPPEKLAEFRAWFEQFDSAVFDSKIESDIHAGKLDHYAAEALRALSEGRTKEM
ncbi:MAG TPA: hypothetical protein VGK90_07935 [Rhizomicrobium sp.]|jgi:hypothetical protein